MTDRNITFLDCTLRDGGYYNNWDFPKDVVINYLDAMQSCGVNKVELGLRSSINTSFKGPFAYSTEAFLATLDLPKKIDFGVMVNASELVGQAGHQTLESLFPKPASESKISFVRIACHTHEFVAALEHTQTLKKKGYQVGLNLMQIACIPEKTIISLLEAARDFDLDVIYFADSLGCMTQENCISIVKLFRQHSNAAIGIHAHDNLGLALSNTIAAINEGASWADSTVTGMGRGPGNVQTEELALELKHKGYIAGSQLTNLFSVVKQTFLPLKRECGWGKNPYYYLAGLYEIHPSYIQVMLSDVRYSDEDILAVIEHLKHSDSKSFNADRLNTARNFLPEAPRGSWSPLTQLARKTVLLIGTGPGLQKHTTAIESYIEKHAPIVIALNTKQSIQEHLINFRVASHHVRMIADLKKYESLEQPIITPYSSLPSEVKDTLQAHEILNFGIEVQAGHFGFNSTHCVTPTSLVAAYALAVAASGKAESIHLVGFDGYSGNDPRNKEMDDIIKLFLSTPGSCPIYSLTPTRYDVSTKSIYGPLQ